MQICVQTCKQDEMALGTGAAAPNPEGWPKPGVAVAPKPLPPMPPPKGADGAPSFAGWPNPDVPVNALIPPPPPPPNPPPESVAGWPNPAPPKGDCAAAGVAVPNMLPEAGGVCIIEAPAAGAAPKGEAAAAGPPPKGLELGAGVLARLPKPNPLCIWLPSHTVRATWDQKPHLKLPRENRCQANMSESKARSKAWWLRIGTRRVELEGDRRDRNHTLQPQAVPSRRGSLLNWRPCRSRPSSSVALRPCRIRPSPWRVLRPCCRARMLGRCCLHSMHLQMSNSIQMGLHQVLSASEHLPALLKGQD